jgi:dihydrofolate reductase
MRHHATVAAPLIFAMLASVDGYIADSSGNFDFAGPDEEVHRFFNELERASGTYLYGRRMYEVMRWWEGPDVDGPDVDDVYKEYAQIWRAADKVVYSATLDSVSTARTRIERSFDPDAVRHMKEAATRPINIAGPGLAAHAWRAGLIDECHLVLAPAIVGGGVRALPDGVRADLELVGERRFSGGMVHLHYRVRERSAA